MTRSARLAPHCLAIVLLLIPLMAAAQQAVKPDYQKELTTLKQLEQQLEAGKLDARQAPLLLNQISTVQTLANQCIQDQTASLEKIVADLKLLGDKVGQELRQVRRGRAELEAAKTHGEQQLASCKLLLLSSQNLLKSLAQLQQSALAERLFAQGPRLDQLLSQDDEEKQTTWESISSFVLTQSGYEHLPDGITPILISAIIGLLLGWMLRRVLKYWAKYILGGHSFSAGLGQAVLSSLGHYAPFVVTMAAASLGAIISMETKNPSATFLVQLGLGLCGYFLLLALVNMLLTPKPPASSYLPLNTDFQQSLSRRLQFLVALSLIGGLLFASPLDDGLAQSVTQVLRAVYAPFLTMNLIWITWLTGSLTKSDSRWPIGLALSLVLLTCLVLEWLGFRNLSQFVVRGLVVTLLGLAMVWLSAYLLRDLYDGLDRGTEAWQRWLRRRIGLDDQEFMPGIFWLRSLTGIVLWGSFILLELRVWGLPESGFKTLTSFFTDGFLLGEINIIPRRLLYALGTLALILLVTGWLKRKLGNTWLNKSRLDRGAKEAVVTITGYFGALTAILASLSVTGVAFTNLAIIAGALSVGIGFGLQNIVNNFVSGLILLMERPIRTGDWIKVGATEGHVKRISIRSTQIQTFDRADVLVPNSELISSQVTNLMLSDTRGRVNIPIGVAYGSNTEKVREILLEIANQHPEVIRDPLSSLQPKVLFLSFGDNALQLELRAFIHDVDSRIGVSSDLNFAIDAAFRRENIEIPFPQRVVHFRETPEPPPAEPKDEDDQT